MASEAEQFGLLYGDPHADGPVAQRHLKLAGPAGAEAFSNLAHDGCVFGADGLAQNDARRFCRRARCSAVERLRRVRSAAFRQTLGAEAGELMPRTKTSDVGSRDNTIGTATDDATDSLDRSVEFKIVGC